MRQFRKATIKEVAARAGVSTTTVSNFVSGNESVCSPETAQRIRQAVGDLHYVPSSLTRGLRHRLTSTIGVCLPYPLDADVLFGSFFLERLWHGILEQADSENYALLHYPRSVRGGGSRDAFLDGRVDGVLLEDHDNQRATQLTAAGMPTILLTRSRQLPDGCGAIWADEAQTIALALAHLWELGHRRIAFVAGPLPGDIAVGRLEGYTDWMRAQGAFDPACVAYAQDWSAPDARTFLDTWCALESPPTAVVCTNDAQALDLLEAARQCALPVPEALSVVGVDNAPAARDSVPPLTSVEAPVDELGRQGLRAVLGLMRGAPLEQCRIALPVTRLVVRQSTGPPAAP